MSLGIFRVGVDRRSGSFLSAGFLILENLSRDDNFGIFGSVGSFSFGRDGNLGSLGNLRSFGILGVLGTFTLGILRIFGILGILKRNLDASTWARF